MAEARPAEKQIVMMSPTLRKLYELRSPGLSDNPDEFHPITFLNPQECLDMMVDKEAEEEGEDQTDLPEEKSMRVQRQWGELELRLSFFSKNYTWQ
jgi:hypothetical protein